jgi:hypothetical protein
MYQLKDTFNNIVISNHRTAENAGKAAAKYTRAVKKHNGEQSYCKFGLYCNGQRVDLNSDNDGDALEFCRGLNGE